MKYTRNYIQKFQYRLNDKYLKGRRLRSPREIIGALAYVSRICFGI